MEQKTQDRLLILGILGLIVAIILYKNGPELIQSRYFYDKDIGHRGAIGDAFGGTAGPIIAWIASILTFMAFYIQYEANKEQRNQFAKQADDTVIERFENRFFELIRIHRENVEEQNIQNIILGRKVFTTYYFELRYIYFVLECNYDTSTDSIKLSKEQLTNLAYLIFFYGIGHVSDSVFSHIAPEINSTDFFKATLKRLECEKNIYSEFLSNKEKYENKIGLRVLKLKNLEINHNGKKAVFIQQYEPFTGHGTKIGHYYRHYFKRLNMYILKKINYLLMRLNMIT